MPEDPTNPPTTSDPPPGGGSGGKSVPPTDTSGDSFQGYILPGDDPLSGYQPYEDPTGPPPDDSEYQPYEDPTGPPPKR